MASWGAITKGYCTQCDSLTCQAGQSRTGTCNAVTNNLGCETCAYGKYNPSAGGREECDHCATCVSGKYRTLCGGLNGNSCASWDTRSCRSFAGTCTTCAGESIFSPSRRYWNPDPHNPCPENARSALPQPLICVHWDLTGLHAVTLVCLLPRRGHVQIHVYEWHRALLRLRDLWTWKVPIRLRRPERQLLL